MSRGGLIWLLFHPLQFTRTHFNATTVGQDNKQDRKARMLLITQ